MLALIAGLGATRSLHAGTVEVSSVHRVVVGTPAGPWPGERGGGERTGLSTVALPVGPVPIWKRSVAARLELSPVIARGIVVVAPASAELRRFDAAGNELGLVRLPGPAAAPPIALADGGVAVITATGVAAAFDAEGAPRFAVPLGVRPRDTDAGIVARERGTVVVTLGRVIIELDDSGSVVARAALDERIVGPAVVSPARRGVLIAGESGTIYELTPPASPRAVGSLGGLPRRGIVLADDRTIIAVINGQRIVALDLPTQARQEHAAPAGATLDGPPAVPSLGAMQVATSTGAVLRIGARGAPRAEVLVERASVPTAAPSTSGFFTDAEPRPNPPLVTDASGRTAFARASGRVGVVGPDGDVTVAGERLCESPVAVTPAAPHRMLLACRDGTLWMLGDP